jgi:hypothetical protein
MIWVPTPPPLQKSVAPPEGGTLASGGGDPNHTTVQKLWYNIYYYPFTCQN